VASKTANDAHARPTKRRLSFHEQHALERLPEQISSLAAEVGGLLRRLEDPGLYGRDPVAFRQTSEMLAAKQAQLEAAEEKWLELAIRREALEGE
jgi:ATP-binding cassette subfamily F protein uup